MGEEKGVTRVNVIDAIVQIVLEVLFVRASILGHRLLVLLDEFTKQFIGPLAAEKIVHKGMYGLQFGVISQFNDVDGIQFDSHISV